MHYQATVADDLLAFTIYGCKTGKHHQRSLEYECVVT